MRRTLLIFMLFLLPIRGLVGDAMAYSMLQSNLTLAIASQQNATDLIAAHAFSHWATAVFDATNNAETAMVPPCHMAMAEADSQDGVQNQCTTCQACHLSAATPLQMPCCLLQTTNALAEQRQVLWYSAEPRWIAKTPIF